VSVNTVAQIMAVASVILHTDSEYERAGCPRAS
jgi:hypothetical protein